MSMSECNARSGFPLCQAAARPVASIGEKTGGMDADDARPPLLAGRGLLLVDDFCRATGLDRATAEGLVKKATVEGLFYPDGRVAGLFDDALPTTEVLRDLGLAVRADYDPEQLRSYEEETDNPGIPDYTENEDSSDSGWTMGWDDRDA